MRIRGWIIAIGLLAGCGFASEADESSVRQRTAPKSSAAAGVGEFETTEVAIFAAGWALEFLPGSGDLLISERTGTLYLRNAKTGRQVKVSGVPKVVAEGQGGLGDVVAGPTFESDRVVYLSWVEAGDGGTGAVVGRAVLDAGGGRPALQDLEVIWRQRPKVVGSAHFSHRIAFDPDGKTMFVTSGDRQQMEPAQDTTNTLGSIVRLTLDGKPAPGNPLADRPSPAPQIYSWGHRNPLGLDFDSDGRLWSSEMGPQGGDELNVITAGGNYGWPKASNGSHYDGREIPDHADGDGFVAPAKSWTPSISPSSLMIYDGNAFGAWKGDAFIGALSGKKLIRVELDGDSAGDEETLLTGQRIRDVEQAPDGSIWVLEDQGSGRLLQLTPSTD